MGIKQMEELQEVLRNAENYVLLMSVDCCERSVRSHVKIMIIGFTLNLSSVVICCPLHLRIFARKVIRIINCTYTGYSVSIFFTSPVALSISYALL
jgi:hypothetical protein